MQSVKLCLMPVLREYLHLLLVILFTTFSGVLPGSIGLDADATERNAR